ncbi:MAG: hypothetical protein ABSF80_04315 [Chitinispirillaceae bacterium]|jgi:hypothetical protein
MLHADGKDPRGLKIAKSVIAIAAVALLGSVFCSRNNPLDPKAGNYNAGTNILLDPGFEDDASSWLMNTAGGRIIDSTVAHSGKCSEKMDMNILGWRRAVWQTVNVDTGLVYSFSGWMKTDSANFGFHMMVYWYSIISPPQNQAPSDTVSGFIEADTLGTLTGKNDWTLFSRNYVAPPGALTAQIYLEGIAAIGAKGTAWFDDISFNAH